MKKVCVVGLWHLGLVQACGFASVNNQVLGLDFDRKKIAELKGGKAPIYEPGLEERLKKLLIRNKLSFTSNPQDIKKCDYVIVAFDTTLNQNDEVDISSIIKAIGKIARYLRKNTPLIITSQVPIGTSEKIKLVVKKHNPSWQSSVAYVPENLKLGEAIERFLNPEMIVVGTDDARVEKEVLSLYQPFKTVKISTDLRTSEMVKHALNTFLATAITFANEIATLSEKLKADGVLVCQILKLDKRVGYAPIVPGLGFSGGTISRDVRQLQRLGKQKKYKSLLLEAIIKINEKTFDRIIASLQKKLGSLANKKIGLLGLTYKPGTSTLRQSPAVKISQKLRKRNALCLAYDPKVSQDELQDFPYIERVKNVYHLAQKSDSLVLLTEWPEFKQLDYLKLAHNMAKPIIFDAKNFLDSTKLIDAGFDYEGFGKKNFRGKS